LAQKNYNIVKNLVFSTITTFSSFFLFILLIFVGRLTGVKQSGIFNTALAVATIFEMFVDLGLRDLTARNVSRDKLLTQKYVGNLLSWKMTLCVTVYSIMLIVVNLFYDYSPDVRMAIYILTVSSFLKSMKYTFRVFFQAHDLFAYDTGLVLLERTSELIFGLIALFVYKTIFAFITAFALVRAADFIIALLILHFKISKIRLQFDWHFIKRLQKESLPLGMFFIILTVFSYIDILMLSKMCPDFNAAGLYSAAFRVYEGVSILPTIIYLVALPRLSELFVIDKKRHYNFAIRIVKYMFLMAIPVVVYGYFFSDFLLTNFYNSKPEFFVAQFALQALFVGIIFQYPNWMLNTILMSVDKQKIIMYVGLISLIFKVLLNLWAIPAYGYEGAAVATVCGEGMIFLLNSVYLRFHHLKVPVIKISFRPIIIGGIIASGFYFGLTYIPLIPLGIILGISYLLFLFLLKIFDQEEIAGFKNNLLGIIKSK